MMSDYYVTTTLLDGCVSENDSLMDRFVLVIRYTAVELICHAP